jgi:hypothetical protein
MQIMPQTKNSDLTLIKLTSVAGAVLALTGIFLPSLTLIEFFRSAPPNGPSPLDFRRRFLVYLLVSADFEGRIESTRLLLQTFDTRTGENKAPLYCWLLMETAN